MKPCPVLLAAVLFLLSSSELGFADQDKAIKISIINAQQRQVDDTTVTETPNGSWLRSHLQTNLQGISPTTQAIPIHALGRCEAPFKSAGGHVNLATRQHGFFDQKGTHTTRAGHRDASRDKSTHPKAQHWKSVTMRRQ